LGDCSSHSVRRGGPRSLRGNPWTRTTSTRGPPLSFTREGRTVRRVLFGRSAEEKRLETLLAHARGGRSSALVLRGEAGIGKTALLEHAVERAEGFRVLRALGVETEAEIAFAGLQQLLRPVVDAFAELPAHQARALGTALALEDGPVPERLVVSAATLTLLAGAAGERPLLCVVDDAHWLDDASAETLVFTARRLHAEGVVLLFAACEPEKAVFSAEGLPELPVHGLAPAAAKALLAERAPSLAERMADQLVALTRGNPLALLELPRSLDPARRADAAPLDEPLPVSAEIERAFLGARRRSHPRRGARSYSSRRATPETPRRSGRRSRRTGSTPRRSQTRVPPGSSWRSGSSSATRSPGLPSTSSRGPRIAGQRTRRSRRPRPSPTGAPGTSPRPPTGRTRRSRRRWRLRPRRRAVAAASPPRRRHSSALRSSRPTPRRGPGGC
jgi:hypothetical protein